MANIHGLFFFGQMLTSPIFMRGKGRMAGSVNKVILVGNLGADPEVRQLDDGQRIVGLRVATSQRWRDRATGEKRERAEWHQVTIFDERAIEFATDHLRKGSKVFVEGRLQTRRWMTAGGENRFSTEVVVNAIGGRLESLTSAAGGDAQIDTTHAPVELSMSGAGKASSTAPAGPFEPPF